MPFSRASLATSMPANDAEFRAWVTAIETAILATGMVVTSDTGQLDVPGQAFPRPAASTKAGYRIYRFNDALQATAPVIMRVDYGMESQANLPVLTFTLGAATNGAGTLNLKQTAALNKRQYASTGRTITPQIPVEMFGSGSMSAGALGGRATVAWDVTSVDNNGSLFHLERTRDADGVPNGRAWWFFILGANAATNVNTRYGMVQTAGANALVSDSGVNAVSAVPGVRPENYGQAGLEGADIPVGMVFPSSGRLWYSVMLIALQNRFPMFQTLPIDHLDASHTYMNLGSNYNNQGYGLVGPVSGSPDSILVPWE